MHDLPLVIFTICMQAAIGIALFSMIAKQVQKDKEFKVVALVAAILSIIGVLASLLHLGVPLQALRSLTSLGSSWLSREILFSGGFMGLTVIYALLIYMKPMAKGAIKAVGWTASIVGIVDVFMMSKVYTSSSIAAWQGASTYIEFYATMIILGIAILFITSVKDLDIKIRSYFGITVLLAVAVQAVFTVIHYIDLGLMGGAGTASASILAENNILVITQWLLLIVGAGVLLFSKSIEDKSGVAKYYATATALCIGLIVGRYLFYAISVASRVGLT